MNESEKKGDRIAKVMARAGVASRRDAERMIVEGRVAVNGTKIGSPALDVLPTDRVTLDGKQIDAPQPARLWLYYKPPGVVTTEKDEKGRQTVFGTLPRDMPRVMSVGRLDLNSEGLLLLTNDGALKRRLELPSTGWLRKYRVRVNGRPGEITFEPLRRGVTIDGEAFLPMEITLDKQQGANAWLTVGIREGKNREVRRAMAEVGLIVNRLIRVSYGPFRLNTMKPGDVIKVKQRVLRDQLGSGATDDAAEGQRPVRGGASRRTRAGPGQGGPTDTSGPRGVKHDARQPGRSKPEGGKRGAPSWDDDTVGVRQRRGPGEAAGPGASLGKPGGPRRGGAKSGGTTTGGKPGPRGRPKDSKPAGSRPGPGGGNQRPPKSGPRKG